MLAKRVGVYSCLDNSILKIVAGVLVHLNEVMLTYTVMPE